jgi:hypothetical protein
VIVGWWRIVWLAGCGVIIAAMKHGFGKIV